MLMGPRREGACWVLYGVSSAGWAVGKVTTDNMEQPLKEFWVGKKTQHEVPTILLT